MKKNKKKIVSFLLTMALVTQTWLPAVAATEPISQQGTQPENADITYSSTDVSDISTQTPAVTFYNDNNEKNGEKIEEDNPIARGKYCVKVHNENCNVVEKTQKIMVRVVPVSVTFDPFNNQYDGKPHTPSNITVEADDKRTEINDSQYEIVYSTDAAGENIVAANKITNAGTYYVVVRDKNRNDDVTILSKPTPFTIKQKEVKIIFSGQYKFTYGDKVVTPQFIFTTTSADKTEIKDIKEGSDYTVTYWEGWRAYTLLDKAPEDAGSYLIRITQGDSGNYAITNTDRAFDIVKNTTSYQSKELNKNLIVGDNHVNISDLLCAGAKIEEANIIADTNGIFEIKPTFDADSKEIRIKIKQSAQVGATENIAVTVTSKNYADYTITIAVTVVDKKTQAELKITNANSVDFGKKLKLSAEGGSTNAEITYIVTNGTDKATLEKVANEYFLVAKQAGNVTLRATMAGNDEYLDAESKPFTITINKIDATGRPDFTEVNKAGVKLNTVELKDTNMTPKGGVFTWNVENPETVDVEQGKSYEWTYTPQGEDANNYNPITGKVVLYPAPLEKVKNVKVKTDNGLFKVTFNKVVDADKYVIAIKQAGKDEWRYINVKNNSFVVKQLYKKPVVKNGKYFIKVAAINEAGRGDYTVAKTIYANRIGTKSAKMYAPKIVSITFNKTKAKAKTAKVIAKKAYVKNIPKKLQYKVSYRLKGTKAWKSAGYSANNIKYVKALKRGKTYVFALRYRYQSSVDGKTYVYSTVAYRAAKVR